jgi:type I restriction enzyme S subunit
MSIDAPTLGEHVELCTEKISAAKDPRLPYIGLEHMAEAVPKLLGSLPSSASTSTNSIFDPGDILFGKLRPNLRKCVRVGFAGYCSTDILVLRARPGVVPEYAAQLLQWRQVARAAVASTEGTKMPRTSWASLKSLPVAIGDPDTQARVAAVLDAIDVAAARTESVIAKLKRMRTGLIADLLSHGVSDQGALSDVDEHGSTRNAAWSVECLGELAAVITSGSRGWAKYYANDGALFVRIGNLTREHLNLRFDDAVHVKPPAGGEGSRTSLEAGDLLISITADLGIIGVVPATLGEAYVNQHIALVRFKPDVAEPRFAGLYLASEQGQRQFARLNDAGAKAGLNLLTIASIRLPLPPIEEQRRIVAVVDAHDARIAVEEAYAKKLRRMKEGLADDVFSGRMSVADIDARVLVGAVA